MYWLPLASHDGERKITDSNSASRLTAGSGNLVRALSWIDLLLCSDTEGRRRHEHLRHILEFVGINADFFVGICSASYFGTCGQRWGDTVNRSGGY